jgi:CRISPR/Cas system CSM-associated protein Csm2 small subunit
MFTGKRKTPKIMGLSTSERYSKVLWTVQAIEDKLRHLSLEYGNTELKSFSGKLWPALLNNCVNKSFWITDGGFYQSSFSGGGFLCEALGANKPSKPDLWQTSANNYIDNNLQLSRILGDSRETKSVVVEIYQLIENFYYAVNRYEDEFSNGMPELENVIANLKGELFNIISRDQEYLRGYLLFQLFDKSIDKYNADCPLSQAINRHCLFHNFGLQKEPFHKVEDLLEAWTEIQFKYTREIPLSKRILLTLALMGRRIGELYQQKNIQILIKDHVGETQLKEVFDYCSEQLVIYKEEQKASYQRFREHQFCQLTSEYY